MSIQVRRLMRGCWRAPKFQASSYRSIAMGIVMTVTICNVILYNFLTESISKGQLPAYLADVLVVSSGVLEGLFSSVWMAIGRWRSRATIAAILITAAVSLGMLLIPNAPSLSGSEFCVTNGLISTDASFVGMTSAARMRLAFIIIVGIVNSACKAVSWNVAVTLLDQTAPQDMTLNYGILLSARVLSLIIIPKFFGNEMATWLLTLSVVIPLLIHGFQLYRLPDPQPDEHKETEEDVSTVETGSLRRVLSSGVAMSQLLAAGLLAAALWGYMWHLSDVLKILFFTVESKDFVTNQTDILYYHVLIFAVIAYGMFYGKSPTFDRISALKFAALCSLIIVPLYLVQTLLLTCQTGIVAGLDNNYTQPSCSQHCRCAVPQSEFAPVCVTDTLTTYLSPCHAGCAGADTIGELTVYRECACAPAAGLRRAAVGACGGDACRAPFLLHKVVTSIIVILTVLTMQMQGVSVLRAVLPRDRSLAVGIGSAAALLITFALTHPALSLLRSHFCSWSAGGRCVVPAAPFLAALGATSSALAGAAAGTALAGWLLHRRSSASATPRDGDLTTSLTPPHQMESSA